MHRDCPFCEELHDPADNAFTHLYGRSRIRLISEGFVIIPTLGQFLPGSLLVIPAEHFERFSDLDGPTRQSALHAIGRAQTLCSQTATLVFEHGATSTTGGGCGIYHAHVHVIPVPTDLRWRDLIGAAKSVPTLGEAWTIGSGGREYLAICDTYGDSAVQLIDDLGRNDYPSQFFRKALVKHFELSDPWDWREYDQPEPRVEDCLNRLESIDSFDVEPRQPQ